MRSLCILLPVFVCFGTLVFCSQLFLSELDVKHSSGEEVSSSDEVWKELLKGKTFYGCVHTAALIFFFLSFFFCSWLTFPFSSGGEKVSDCRQIIFKHCLVFVFIFFYCNSSIESKKKKKINKNTKQCSNDLPAITRFFPPEEKGNANQLQGGGGEHQYVHIKSFSFFNFFSDFIWKTELHTWTLLYVRLRLQKQWWTEHKRIETYWGEKNWQEDTLILKWCQINKLLFKNIPKKL